MKNALKKELVKEKRIEDRIKPILSREKKKELLNILT
jgi:hypothetical protein